MTLRPSHALVFIFACLSGCSILPPAESPIIYRLPATPTPAGDTTVTWSLRVDAPQTDPTLDSTHIAVMPTDHVITVYKGARWIESAPQLLRDRLIDGFRTEGSIRALSSGDASLQSDIELTGKLRDFQTSYENGRPVVVVAYDAQLVQTGSLRIIAAHTFQLRQPVAGKEVPQVVEAFGQASDQLAAQVVSWVLRSSVTTAPH